MLTVVAESSILDTGRDPEPTPAMILRNKNFFFRLKRLRYLKSCTLLEADQQPPLAAKMKLFLTIVYSWKLLTLVLSQVVPSYMLVRVLDTGFRVNSWEVSHFTETPFRDVLKISFVTQFFNIICYSIC